MVANAVKETQRFQGVYTVADAAALILAALSEGQAVDRVQDANSPGRITSRRLFRWVREGLAGDYLPGLGGREVALTFLDLVSLRLISTLRAHGVPPADIRLTHRGLQEARGWTHPFAMEPVWISGLGVLIREHAIPVRLDGNRNWQAAQDFWDVFVGPGHRLTFDREERASAWEPEDGIVLNPQVSFGEPCLTGTRIATQTLWALHAAGDSAERIAEAYDMPVERVEAALAWERKLGYNGAS